MNPGIINTVKWLNDNGFKTTDSGDGETHDYECDLAVPYVHILVEPLALISETDRLVGLLKEKNIYLEPQNASGTARCVEATYFPDNEIAVISLFNVKF